ncbi:hypothetical protein HKX48_000875 [Thoreauomyces humboldtii]|nr:hypothetical protein HKX48_000875 [Thoreauomyces humboldtii]
MSELWKASKKAKLLKADGWIYKPMDGKPCAYVRYTEYEKYINLVLGKNKMFKSSPKRFADIINHLKMYNDAELPFMEKDPNVIAFDNGVLLLDTVVFHAYGSPAAKNKVARHYLSQIYTGKTHTPVFDNLLYHQLKDISIDEAEAVYNMFLALVGRSFFLTGEHDNLSIAPCLLGDSNTGKSTIINIIEAMHSQDSVGAISANTEATFGLDNLFDKSIVVIPEIPPDMHNVLNPALLQSMISGENINVPGKYKKSFTGRFRPTIWMAGNVFPKYQDKRGAVARRLPIFTFEQFIEKRDGTIEKTIKENELGDLICKCLKAYWKMLLEHKGKDFWEFCPSYFIDNRELASVATNWLHRFLTASPDENRSRDMKYYVRKTAREGDNRLKTPIDDVKKLFTNYMKFNHPGEKINWEENDYSTFKALGYQVLKEHTCKACGEKARGGKDKCCKNYAAANRTKRTFVYDMEIVREEIAPPPQYKIKSDEAEERFVETYHPQIVGKAKQLGRLAIFRGGEKEVF